jgi:hypothetical protein
MAPESLRTLESPETSNVLAAEGSPERRKRKQLAGRVVGRIPPRSALKLLQLFVMKSHLELCLFFGEGLCL